MPTPQPADSLTGANARTNVRGTGLDVQGAQSSANVLSPEYSEFGDLILNIYQGTNLYAMFATPEISQDIPGNAGSRLVQWFRYPYIDQAPEIVEGTTPPPQRLSRQRVTKALTQRGTWVQFTDQLLKQTIHNLPQIVFEKIAESFSSTDNQQAQDSLFLTTTPSSGNFPTNAQGGNVAGSGDLGNTLTNVSYGGNKSGYSALTTSDRLSLAKIRAVVEPLENNHTPMLLPRVPASPNVDTHPGDPAYIGLTDLVGKRQLEQLTTGTGADSYYTFEAAKNYSQPTAILPNEIGRTGPVRWFYSTKTAWAGTGTTSGVGRRAVIIGQDAFGMSAMTNQRFQLLATNVDQADKFDPLGLVGSLGYKYMAAYTILNPNYMGAIYYVG